MKTPIPPEEMARIPRVFGYVRFSNEEQKGGSSVDRQVGLIKKFASDHSLPAPDVETFVDLGVSGFTGANLAKGRGLRAFLDELEAGNIGKGDWLIVESLDRLSRGELEDAFPLLTSITSKGIKVGTAMDGHVLQKGGYKLEAFMRIGIAQELANRESQQKSDRVCRGWADSRAKINEGLKLTAKCPGWLTLSADRRTFTVTKDRAALVRRVFQLTGEGRGKGHIARVFNMEKVPNWKKTGAGWSETTIGDILRNRAVLGEFTPCKMKDGKRQPAGEPFKNYFPRIVSDADFYATQGVVKARRNTGGRAVTSCNNLFTRLCFCGECGGPIHYVDKTRGARYLRCDRTARRLSNCKPSNIRYDAVEIDFIHWIVDFDFTGSTKTERAQTEGDLDAAIGVAEEAQKQIDRLTDAMAKADDLTDILIPRIQAAKRERDAARISVNNFKVALSNIKEKAFTGDIRKLSKDSDNRFRLREEIRRRVSKIVIHFKAPEDWPDADPFFWVTLKDGSAYAIKDGQTAHYWTKEGKHYFNEPEPPDDLDPKECPWPEDTPKAKKRRA